MKMFWVDVMVVGIFVLLFIEIPLLIKIVGQVILRLTVQREDINLWSTIKSCLNRFSDRDFRIKFFVLVLNIIFYVFVIYDVSYCISKMMFQDKHGDTIIMSFAIFILLLNWLGIGFLSLRKFLGNKIAIAFLSAMGFTLVGLFLNLLF